MSTIKCVEVHNLVVFLSKPIESEGFEQIVDFLNANPIKHALTGNPIVYTSCIEQFLATVKVKTVDREGQLQALVDGKKILITKSTIRRDLQLEDAKGVDCLPNIVIFEQLTLMGKLQQRVLHLETTKTTQALKIDNLKRRVKKLERRKRSRTHGLKRIYKVSLSARVESSEDEGLGEEDASKHEW
nr:hypothetical protein [Tanacetum cinerariifolium]